MDVTRHNYTEALKQITTLLKNADFISFDTELTGLGRSLGDRNHDLDTPKERYVKSMKRVREYGLIQIGITIFRYCNTSHKYFSATYCFYLSGKKDASYRFDTSSMMFLAENGFDFNKLFLEGMTFIPLSEEAEIRKKREDKKVQEMDIASSPPVKLRDENARKFVKDSIAKVKEAKDKKEIVLEGKQMNGFFRKVLFNNVAPMFPKCHFESQSGAKRDIKVRHFDSDTDKNKFIDDMWEKELSEQIGFAHIIKIILESNKPLVGHNIILDVLHLVDKFVTPLPEELDEFKSIVKSNLPAIYDTKLFAKDPPFSANILNTALAILYEELSTNYSPPSFETETGYKSYSIQQEGQAHDGGFDAFMTGVCFITMLKTLEGKNYGKNDLMKSKHLENYENRINFMGSHDIPFIDLNKADVIPKRSHIYTVSCPSTWSNVRQVFGSLKGYKAVWVNDTFLHVIPQDEGDAAKSSKLLEGIRAACPPMVKVTMYQTPQRVTNLNKKTGRTKGVVRPSSIALKRRSVAKETDESATANEGEEPESARNLKRLKSVGSELLSNMSLESPMTVDKELPGANANDAIPTTVQAEPSDMFNVPDNW